MALLIPKIKMPNEHDFHFIHVYANGDAFWEEEDQCFKDLGKAVEIPDGIELIDKQAFKKKVEGWAASHTANFTFIDFIKLIEMEPNIAEVHNGFR